MGKSEDWFLSYLHPSKWALKIIVPNENVCGWGFDPSECLLGHNIDVMEGHRTVKKRERQRDGKLICLPTVFIHNKGQGKLKKSLTCSWMSPRWN